MPRIDISDSIHWTEEQWKEYEEANVTLSLENYDALCQAVNLLVRGSRLKEEDRSSWGQRVEQIHETVLPQLPEFAQ